MAAARFRYYPSAQLESRFWALEMVVNYDEKHWSVAIFAACSANNVTLHMMHPFACLNREPTQSHVLYLLELQFFLAPCNPTVACFFTVYGAQLRLDQLYWRGKSTGGLAPAFGSVSIYANTLLWYQTVGLSPLLRHTVGDFPAPETILFWLG